MIRRDAIIVTDPGGFAGSRILSRMRIQAGPDGDAQTCRAAA
ncbi:hypothetical protein [Trebonia kvetii]|nr:hypothetical protein [Trebonia kvetii]